jgi:hypothetical protein
MRKIFIEGRRRKKKKKGTTAKKKKKRPLHYGHFHATKKIKNKK